MCDVRVVDLVVTPVHDGTVPTYIPLLLAASVKPMGKGAS